MNRKSNLLLFFLVFLISCGPPPEDDEISFLYSLEGMEFSAIEYSELNSNTWASTTGSMLLEINDSFSSVSFNASGFIDKNFFACDVFYEAGITTYDSGDGELSLGDPYPRQEEEPQESPVQKVFKSIEIKSETLSSSPGDCDLNPKNNTTWHFELFQNGDLIVTDFGRDVEYFLRPTKEPNNEQ